MKRKRIQRGMRHVAGALTVGAFALALVGAGSVGAQEATEFKCELPPVSVDGDGKRVEPVTGAIELSPVTGASSDEFIVATGKSDAEPDAIYVLIPVDGQSDVSNGAIVTGTLYQLVPVGDDAAGADRPTTDVKLLEPSNVQSDGCVTVPDGAICSVNVAIDQAGVGSDIDPASDLPADAVIVVKGEDGTFTEVPSDGQPIGRGECKPVVGGGTRALPPADAVIVDNGAVESRSNSTPESVTVEDGAVDKGSEATPSAGTTPDATTATAGDVLTCTIVFEAGTTIEDLARATGQIVNCTSGPDVNKAPAP